MEVYDEPVAIQIPVPDGSRAGDLVIYYYSESSAHSGWYPADAVDGWMVSGSRRTVRDDGETFIEIQVNHGGIVALGRAAQK